MRAAAIQYAAASGWRTSRGGSSEGDKKNNVLFNKSAEITLISQPQDNDESSAARMKKKKRSVRDRKQEVATQSARCSSILKALTKLLISQLAAGDNNAGRGETKKR